jgi:hypothetical protein
MVSEFALARARVSWVAGGTYSCVCVCVCAVYSSPPDAQMNALAVQNDMARVVQERDSTKQLLAQKTADYKVERTGLTHM